MSDPDLSRTLEYLIERGTIRPTAAFGIARKMIVSGEQFLTQRQRQIYRRSITPLLDLACTRCGKAIRIGEIIGAYENGGLYRWCIETESSEG